MSSESKDPAYLAGYKDGYQMGKSEVRTCKNVWKDGTDWPYCSECGELKGPNLPHCPNCGAKVIGD